MFHWLLCFPVSIKISLISYTAYLGKHRPQGDGVLIFDKVKVACQLVWNSRNQKLSGLAMTHNDLWSLIDIYQILQQPHQTPKQAS